MLSILIPIFNFDVRSFVKELSDQSEKLDVPVEILCFDDASDAKFQVINQDLAEMTNVRYEKTIKNLGRSAVRNRMVELADYDYLLFLDCDGKVLNESYLQDYLSTPEADVVYGGRVYQEHRPLESNLHFHWYCGKAREEVDVERRKESPFKSFMTNNFMIKRSVYERVKMDETVEGYGHEDTLFAAELRRMGYRITHIDNPIEHIGIEDVHVFLQKSANAVRNLARMIYDNKVDESIKIVYYYRLLNKFKMLSPITYVVFQLEKRMIQNMQSAAPNLAWFDLWKLALLNKEMHKLSKLT
ncbi:MAG: glycosyltransferase [Salibacteraceae bacterium]